MKALEQLLSSIGLDPLQIEIYSEVYERGRTTVLELARVTGIKRPTVHFHVAQLIEKGFFTEGVRQGRRVITAKPPELLSEIVEEQKRKVAQMELSLNRMLEEIETVERPESLTQVTSTVESGEQAVNDLYKVACDYGEVYSYIDTDKATELLRIRMGVIDHIATKQKLSGFTELYASRDVAVPDYVKKLKVHTPFTFKKTSMQFKGAVNNIVVYGHCIAIVSKREGNYTILKVEQPLLAVFLKELFCR